MDINETALYAQRHGYDGVIVQNVVDEGGQGDVNWDENVPKNLQLAMLYFLPNKSNPQQTTSVPSTATNPTSATNAAPQLSRTVRSWNRLLDLLDIRSGWLLMNSKTTHLTFIKWWPGMATVDYNDTVSKGFT